MKKADARSAHGFTLLELLVVVVIITLVSAFVAPRMLGTLTHMNLKTSAHNLAAALRYARSQAVSEQVAYAARFDLEANAVRVSRVEAAEEASEGETEEVVASERVYSLPGGIALGRSEASSAPAADGPLSIEFYPDGNSSGGEVILTDERGRRYIVWADVLAGTVGADACGEDCR